MTIWAFAQIPDANARQLVYESIHGGKSRFGCWGSGDLRKNWDGKLAFLRSIKKGDWIVHVNSPCWGKCVAVEVSDEYNFDDGIDCSWGADFNHFIPVDSDSIIEFDRKDKNVLPTVNLNPRSRYHRIHARDDFLKSINNLTVNKVNLEDGQTKEIYHLQDKTQHLLPQLTSLIHSTHKSKNLERFLAKVFRKLPNVVDVNENGFGWGTDYGADLIITLQTHVGSLEIENKIIVQVKSFEGEHNELSTVDQVVTGIKKYDGNAGIIITTAEATEKLESDIQKKSEEIGKPIDLIAGDDVAKLVMKYASDLLFDLKLSNTRNCSDR